MKLLKMFSKKPKKIYEGIIRKPKEGWYNPDANPPKMGDKVKIDCGELGERESIYFDPLWGLIKWHLTDCTHPMQNTNMSDQYVMGWRPLGNTVVTEDAQYEEIIPLQLTNKITNYEME